MLIVLSGVETVNKRFFAGKITEALNNFELDGYRIDFTKPAVEVYDSENNLVWAVGQPGENPLLTDEDGFLKPAGVELANRIIALQETIFTDGLSSNHYSNIFADPTVDYGFLPAEEMLGRTSGYNRQHSYDLLLESYNARTLDNFVITGSFSKLVVEQLRRDLGGENVLVLNMIRNPSTCFLLNEKAPEYYAEQADRTPTMDDYKLQKSILNAIILRGLEGVVTLKFEDIIVAGSFDVNGVNISVPAGYNNYNDILTQWEMDTIIPLAIVGNDRLNEVNAFYSDYSITTDAEIPTEFPTDPEGKQALVDAFNAQFNSNITVEVAEAMFSVLSTTVGPKKLIDLLPLWNATNNVNVTREQVEALVPSNLFAALEYTPLDYAAIIAPK